MRRYHKNNKGFTMAEMLITVAIIVILCGFGFVAVIAHQRNLKRMEMDETAQEIFIAAQNHLTAAEANGQWDAFLKKTSGAASGAEAARGTELSNGPTGYDKTSDTDADSRKFYSFTTESNETVQKGAVSLILPEGSIDETLRGHHFYVEYDAVSGTVYGVFYTDADHPVTEEDAENVSRTDPNARRDYKDENGKRTIIGYYGGALGELKNSEDLYAPAVAVRNAESLVLYVVDKNYHRPASSETSTENGTQNSDENAFRTTLQLTFEGEASGAKTVKTIDPATLGSQEDSFSKSVLARDSVKDFQVVVPGKEQNGSQKTVNRKAKYYAIVLDSIVRENGHFADLFQTDDQDASKKFIPGEDVKITVTLHSDKGGEDVSQTVCVNSLFNSVKKEKNAFGMETGKAVVTVSNPRHLENLSSKVSGVDFVSKKIVKDTTVDTVSVVRNLFWDEDAAAEKAAKDENEKETVTAFLPAIASATGMESPFGYCADGSSAENTKDKAKIQVYPYVEGTSEEKAGTADGAGAKAENAGENAAEISKGACYGITNTAVQTFKGNNHMLAAFRFEGKQESALINRAAAAIKVSDLVIADSTSCVTGEIQNSDQEVPTAALLIAKANSGYAGNDNSASVENVRIIWYQDGANKDGITTGNSKVTTAPAETGTRVYSENGIASLLIGSIDANNKLPDEEGKTPQQGTLTNKFTIKNVTIQAGDFGTNKTANVGVEGNIAAGMIGEIKSGAVTIGNSDDQTENWKANIKINGTLTLNAVKEENSVAGGLIGKVADTASSSDDALTLQKVYLEADTLTMNGRKDKNNSILGGIIGSAAGGKSVHVENADLIAKSVNGGVENNQELNAGTTGGIIGSVTAGTKTTLKNIRFTSAESRLGGKQAAGGVIGSLASGEASLESVNVLATNKNEVEGQGQSAVKTFRDIKVASSDNASLTINADTGSDSAAGGLIGNVSGQASNLSITKSSVKTVTADDKDVNLTVTGANIGGLIGICGSAATTIGGDAASEVVLTVQGNFALGQSAQAAGNAGGLIGKIGQNGNAGNITATIQNVPLTARTMHAYAAGNSNGNGTVGGFVGYVAAGSSTVSLDSCNLSANSADLGERSSQTNSVKAAGGAVGKISSGTVSLSNLTVLTPKASQDAGEGAGNNYIRVIADQGMAGGLVGVAESGTTQLAISNAAVSGSGVNDQIEAGSSAGGLVGNSAAAQTNITGSMASMYVQADGIRHVSDSTTGAGGLVGSASGAVTIENSYSGGRTTGGKYADSSDGQGRYNVYLKASTGAAGGILGKMASGSLKVTNSYSTSSVAVPKTNATGNGANAGGFVGFADSLNAENTYCTGRVYVIGNGSAGTGATPHYGAYAGNLTSLSGQENYYLKGIKGATDNAVGTLEHTSDIDSVKTKISGKLTETDYDDNNSALRNNVPSDQKTYCYDTALQGKAYPLKSATTASARPLYDPNTGDKVTGESADGNRYAQIGDWEVPEKQSLDGAYGLIYYERIQGDDTFYYHGYMLASGDSAQNATYTEVSNDGSSDPFVHDAGKYVIEDGYLLLVRNAVADAEKELHFGFGNIEEGIKGAGHNFAKIANVNKYNLDKSLCESLKDYCAYYVAFDPSNVENSYYYNPSDTDMFGAVLAIWDIPVWTTDKQPKAAFTYLPFFADTVQGADSGQPKSVAKASKGSEKAQAIIRSARQLQLLAKCENNNKTAYLNNNKQIIVEQQMDISFSSDVQFSNPLQIDGVDAHQSPTFEQISYKSEFRSAKCGIKQDSYYELIGLRSPFAKKVNGIISNLQIEDMRALHFVGSIQGKEARVQNVVIDDALLGDKDTPSQHGGFADTMDGGIIENCHINNAIIYGDGFIHQAGKTDNIGTIENCSIVNAKISGNGFIGINSVDINGCGLYSNKDLYEKRELSNYSIVDAGNGEYDYLSIGQSTTSSDVSGFIGKQETSNISRCFVTGTIYGYNVSGFIANFVSGKVNQCYSNVLINASHDAFGFCGLINGNSGNTSLTKCHALGQIKALNNSYGCVGSVQNQVDIQQCYTAFWKVEAKSWYPFYGFSSNKQKIQNNFYLTDSALLVENGELVDYSNQVRGLTYQQLCDLSLEGQQYQADTTIGYYRYMQPDSDHQIYPYPMPAGMTAYGDWSHTDPDCYTMLYYEKIDGKYYFHGYTTENGESYTELSTSGENVKNGLLAAAGQKVEDDGYVLIAGTNSSWSTFGRADNSGAVSSPINNANTQIFKSVTSSDAELLKALENLQGLKKKNTDKIYIFQPERYLNYADTTKNFASWQTLTQESGGIGISIYSTKGSTPMARFSFQPFFADTVKAPEIASNGSSGDKKITFVTTRDSSDSGCDYRIRSLRQLKALSDWDAKKLGQVAQDQNIQRNFDADTENRDSYLSSEKDNLKQHLTIRQDLDIDVNGYEINFVQMDGTYCGRTYRTANESTPVSLKNIGYDFADKVASTGTIRDLVIDEANLQGTGTTAAAGGETAHGGQREFVEYNYGTLANITVQNSKLGSAGIVYQNGDVTQNILKKTSIGPTYDRYMAYVPDEVGYSGKNVHRFYFTNTYSKGEQVRSGIIKGCKVTSSSIQGAGLVWRNKGGWIDNSTVEECASIGASGFIEYNESTSITAPQTEKEYVYLYQDNWTTDPAKRVPESIVNKYQWTKSESNGTVSIQVDATVTNCTVRDMEWQQNTAYKGITGNGFVGENKVATSGGQQGAGDFGNAKIENCRVINVVAAKNGFAGENSNGAEISNCAVYVSKEKASSAKDEPYTLSSIGNPTKDQSAGFIGTNGESSTIDSCSFTGQIQGKNIGGFVYTNKGTITNSYANISQKWNNTKIQAAGFVYVNSGTISYCHALGQFGGSQTGKDGNNNGQAAGFVWNSKAGSEISNSYTAVWSEAHTTSYWLFANTNNIANDAKFKLCYAMKPDNRSFTPGVNGISFVTGTQLKGQTDDLGSASGAATVTYTTNVETPYGFPVPTTITNYGDWYSTWDQNNHPSSQNGGSGYAVSLTSGPGTFPDDAVAAGKALSADGDGTGNTALYSMEDAEASSAVTGNTDDGSTNEIDLTLVPEEDSEDGEAAATLDLSTFTPVRKGWKLLGWLITSPSDLSASEKKTTVSDIVTKINKISDGDAEQSADAANTDDADGADTSENAAEGSGQTEQNQTETSGSSKDVYELETGTKSYHYAPDAVITVTEDMTLAAVWVPDDDTIAKAKDGTLRMDENGNILDDDADADTAGIAGTGSSDQADTALTEDTAQTAGTAQTGDAATTEDSSADGATENGAASREDSDQAGTGETQNSAGNGQTADSAGTDPAESGESGQDASSQDAGSSAASTEAATYSAEDAEPVRDSGV